MTQRAPAGREAKPADTFQDDALPHVTIAIGAAFVGGILSLGAAFVSGRLVEPMFVLLILLVPLLAIDAFVLSWALHLVSMRASQNAPWSRLVAECLELTGMAVLFVGPILVSLATVLRPDWSRLVVELAATPALLTLGLSLPEGRRARARRNQRAKRGTP